MLTVASYNIRKAIGTDRLRRPERTLEVLCEIDADVVALQEADRRFGARVSAIPPEMIEAKTPYKPVHYDIRPDSIGWHGNALLVDKEATILDQRALALPTLEPRGAVVADLRHEGAEFRVVGMHLDLSGVYRRKQARAIIEQLDAMQPLPTVLMGDCNEWRPLGSCMLDFGHRYRLAHTGKSFHARRPVAALDRIMVGDGVEIAGAGVHHSARARRASDHLPVWARVSFANA